MGRVGPTQGLALLPESQGASAASSSRCSASVLWARGEAPGECEERLFVGFPPAATLLLLLLLPLFPSRPKEPSHLEPASARLLSSEATRG